FNSHTPLPVFDQRHLKSDEKLPYRDIRPLTSSGAQTASDAESRARGRQQSLRFEQQQIVASRRAQRSVNGIKDLRSSGIKRSVSRKRIPAVSLLVIQAEERVCES